MKIQTEIRKTILIVTCINSRLDAPVAVSFFKTIQNLIKKGHKYIALDLSNVVFVDSSGLGALVRCLKELDNQGQLVLFGVNNMFLSLLQLTKMEGVFTRSRGKNEAVEFLLYNRERSIPSGDSGQKEGDPLKMEKKEEIQEVAGRERRRHKRIMNKHIVDQETVVSCTNTRSGKRSSATILNISPGGLLLLSSAKFSVGDEYMVEGAVGTAFTFKELAVICQVFDGQCGLEFVNPSSETTQFLHQLTGSVSMGKGTIVN